MIFRSVFLYLDLVRRSLSAPLIEIVLVSMLVLSSGFAKADNAQYFYDPAGRLTGMVDPVNGSAIYTYDAVGNILSVVRRPLTSIVVTEVSPNRGRAGVQVTIAGTGFGTTGNTSVSFHGTAATVTSVSSTQIVATVPAGVTTGAVSVTSPAGTAGSVAPFTVATSGPPLVSGFSPTQADQGATLTVSGTGFDTILANDKLFINGRYASVTAATATSLTAIVPAATSGPVTVTTTVGTATGTNLVVPPLPYLSNSIGSVATVAIGQSGTSAVNTAGQIGLLLFTASAGQGVSFYVPTSTFGNATLALYGPDGSIILAPVNIVSGSSTPTQILPNSGTYTILIAPGSGQTGSANVSLNTDVTGSIAIDGGAVTLTTTIPSQNMSLTFSGNAGQRITLTNQSSGGSLSCSLQLLEPNSITQLYSLIPFNCGNDFSDVLTLPVTGVYSIQLIAGYGSTGSMTFTLQSVPPPATGTLTIDGSSTTLTRTTPGQDMVVTFAGTAGQRIDVNDQLVSGNINPWNNYIQIIEPDGKTQLYNGGSNGSSTFFSDVLVLPTSGTYQILANHTGAQLGSIQFSINSVPPDVTGTLTIDGGSASLSTTVPGQNMSLKFAGTAGQRIALNDTLVSGNINPYNNNPVMFEPDGSTQIFNSGSNGSSTLFSDVIVLPVSGTYSIRFDLAGMQTGTVTFSVTTVPPDATTTIAANGNPVSLTTTTPGQNMSLTFPGTVGQRVALNEQIVSGNINPYNNGIIIVEPDGSTQLYNGSSAGSSTLFSDVLVLPVAGTYTISFNLAGMQTGTVSFTLYNEPADASPTITAGGGSIGVTITTPGQNATLSFAGTAGRRVALLTQRDSGLSASCDTLQVLQPGGTTQLYNANVCSSSDFSGVLPKPAAISTSVPTLPTTGTYTIPFNPSSTSTGTATFTLYDVPPDTAGTTTIGAAAANYAVSIPGQAIRVTFPGTANQNATINVGVVISNPASPCYTITTLEPDGTSILRGDQSCSGSYSSGSLTLPQSGTYTVVVAPAGTTTGTFSIGVTTP